MGLFFRVAAALQNTPVRLARLNWEREFGHGGSPVETCGSGSSADRHQAGQNSRKRSPAARWRCSPAPLLIGGFHSHNPVDSQHEGEVVGGQADGLQDDGDGDDASSWDARCAHARGCGRHPGNSVEPITTTGRSCAQEI